jgi:ribosomal protein S18 acetylase RimI-like enzyme
MQDAHEKIAIRPTAGAADLEAVRGLFSEYAAGLDFDLDFQDFSGELANLPGSYAPPRGCLLLAERGIDFLGCIALRPLDEGTCEMKRLFVRPAGRGLGLGRKLIAALLDRARALGYRTMRLDTAPGMEAAQALYREFGFRDIAPYCYNPLPGARFMECDLRRPR